MSENNSLLPSFKQAVCGFLAAGAAVSARTFSNPAQPAFADKLTPRGRGLVSADNEVNVFSAIFSKENCSTLSSVEFYQNAFDAGLNNCAETEVGPFALPPSPTETLTAPEPAGKTSDGKNIYELVLDNPDWERKHEDRTDPKVVVIEDKTACGGEATKTCYYPEKGFKAVTQSLSAPVLGDKNTSPEEYCADRPANRNLTETGAEKSMCDAVEEQSGRSEQDNKNLGIFIGAGAAGIVALCCIMSCCCACCPQKRGRHTEQEMARRNHGGAALAGAQTDAAVTTAVTMFC